MLSGTGFAQNNGLLVSNGFVEEIKTCFNNEFKNNLMEERISMLNKFSNERNITNLIGTIFNA